MSDYFYWRYRLRLAGPGSLNAVTRASEVEGALLRDQGGGHACLQPWPSLGQGDLDCSLALLRDGGDSDLLRAVRRCLALDGAARAAGIGLFEGKSIPPSHLSVPDWADLAWLEAKFSAGFTYFKLKCGRDFGAAASRVDHLCAHFGGALRLRLDFNQCLDLVGFRALVDLLGKRSEQIDFIEDPIAYQPDIWRKLSGELPFDLALDHPGTEAIDGFQVRVIKPAWGDTAQGGVREVFTTAMDHPIGQLFAAHQAAESGDGLGQAGLLTHWLFEPDPFSEGLQVDGECRLVPPGGAGLGFSELLDGLPWKAV